MARLKLTVRGKDLDFLKREMTQLQLNTLSFDRCWKPVQGPIAWGWQLHLSLPISVGKLHDRCLSLLKTSYPP